MSFLLFILLMAVVMIVTPLLGTFIKIYRQTRRVRDMFRNFGAAAGGFGGDREESQRSRGGWTYPLKRKKKVYTRDMGEYVDFKEVTVTDTETTTETRDASGHTHTTYVREQQVTDVEWEEIS